MANTGRYTMHVGKNLGARALVLGMFFSLNKRREMMNWRLCAMRKWSLTLQGQAGALWVYDDAYIMTVPNDEAKPKMAWQVDL